MQVTAAGLPGSNTINPNIRGDTSVVVFKWDKAWMMVTPAVAKLMMPDIFESLKQQSGASLSQKKSLNSQNKLKMQKNKMQHI